jgi:hypothetical protein
VSQNDAILAALLAGRVLTTLDIFKLCGSMAGHSRINDLRKLGHNIPCKRVTRNGRGVWEYTYVGSVQRELPLDTVAEVRA